MVNSKLVIALAVSILINIFLVIALTRPQPKSYKEEYEKQLFIIETYKIADSTEEVKSIQLQLAIDSLELRIKDNRATTTIKNKDARNIIKDTVLLDSARVILSF